MFAVFVATMLEAVVAINSVFTFENFVNAFTHGRFVRGFICESCVSTESGQYGSCQ